MSSSTNLKETLQSVMKAHTLVKQFHQNVADLFRALEQILEEHDTPYHLLDPGGDLWTAEISSLLREPKRWDSRHFGIGFIPVDQHDLPILLFNVSMDPQFAEEPELWLGLLTDFQSKEVFPPYMSLHVVYEDEFTPDEAWQATEEWFEQTIHHADIQANMSFMRVPLHRIDGRKSLETLLEKHLFSRLLAWMEQEAESDGH